MSTALTIPQNCEELNNSIIQAIRPDSPMIEALTENAEMGVVEPLTVRDLIMVKMPSGETSKWIVDDLGGTEMFDELVGVPVLYKPAGVIWPYAKQTPGVMPYIRTTDLKVGVEVGEDPGDLDLDLLQTCQTGTDEQGRMLFDWQAIRKAFWNVDTETGKRVKESRLICLLRPDSNIPIVVRISPASLKPVVSFFKLLMNEVPLFRAVISLGLEKAEAEDGTKYYKATIKQTGTLSREEGQVIKQVYTQRLGGALEEVATSMDSDVDHSDEGEDDTPV